MKIFILKELKPLKLKKEYLNLILKSRSSYNEIFLKKDKNKIENNLKEIGYFSNVEVVLTELDDGQSN